jgi:hypothetical protein
VTDKDAAALREILAQPLLTVPGPWRPVAPIDGDVWLEDGETMVMSGGVERRVALHSPEKCEYCGKDLPSEEKGICYKCYGEACENSP